jgi:glycerol-3-phosphate dehydrogenase
VKRDLGRLTSREHDLLVIGGGISGAACAWDAAQRGLQVALVEAGDFCSGASWNSLKTIHGGLRHLQRGDLPSLRESMRERRSLLRIAAPLLRPLGFLVPTYGHGRRGRELLGAGLWLNDLLTPDRNHGLATPQQIPRARVLSRARTLEAVPGLPAHGLSGGVLWYDAQVRSSERLVLGFLHAAASAGAALANYVEVTELLRAEGRVIGARLRDRAGDVELTVRARLVLSAAGAAVNELSSRAGLPRRRVPLLRAYNLVLRRCPVGTTAIGRALGGRYLFVVPWEEHAILGTGYAPEDDSDGAAALLRDARRAFPWVGLEEGDVGLVHAERVPGSDGGAGLWTRHRLVDHEREDGVPGLISLISVKYTTARGVAEQAIDLAVACLGRRFAPCRTSDTPLPGLELAADPAGERARLVVREEMALHLTDVVLRRLDLGTAGRPGEAQLDEVALAVADELGWDAARQQQEREALEAAFQMASLPQSR